VYQAAYDVLAPVSPLLLRIAPNHVTTTARLGRAMIQVADRGSTSASSTAVRSTRLPAPDMCTV